MIGHHDTKLEIGVLMGFTIVFNFLRTKILFTNARKYFGPKKVGAPDTRHVALVLRVLIFYTIRIGWISLPLWKLILF